MNLKEKTAAKIISDHFQESFEFYVQVSPKLILFLDDIFKGANLLQGQKSVIAFHLALVGFCDFFNNARLEHLKFISDSMKDSGVMPSDIEVFTNHLYKKFADFLNFLAKEGAKHESSSNGRTNLH